MASKNNRKLSGVVLTGALVAPAVMSAAQQNVASADFLSSLKSWGSWAGNVAMKGINAARSTTYGKIGLCTLAAVGLIGLGCALGYLLDLVISDDDKLDDAHYLESLEKVEKYLKSGIDSPISLLFSQGDSDKSLRAVKIEKKKFRKAFEEYGKDCVKEVKGKNLEFDAEKFENGLLKDLLEENNEKFINRKNFKGFLVPYKKDNDKIKERVCSLRILENDTKTEIDGYEKKEKSNEERLAEKLNKIQEYLNSKKSEGVGLLYLTKDNDTIQKEVEKVTFKEAFEKTVKEYSKEDGTFDFDKKGFKEALLQKLGEEEVPNNLRGVWIPNKYEKNLLDFCPLPE
jgi:lipoate-protein ligase A